MNEVKIKYGELARAMKMGHLVLTSTHCEDCGAPKSMTYKNVRRCFNCWGNHIAPKQKTKKKDRVKA